MSDNETDRSLIAFLQDHDVACGECGYNLRGAAEPKCPECGWAVDMTTTRKPTMSFFAVLLLWMLAFNGGLGIWGWSWGANEAENLFDVLAVLWGEIFAGSSPEPAWMHATFFLAAVALPLSIVALTAYPWLKRAPRWLLWSLIVPAAINTAGTMGILVYLVAGAS